MQKNVASQKLIVFAFDSTTNLPKTGDAANITAYRSLDYGSVTVLTDTSATEMDSTNAKGYYLFDLTQGETNGDTILFSAKSSTANIVVVGAPATVFTTAPNFSLQSIDSNGRVDVIKVNGTSQTAGDIYSKVSGLTFTVASQVDVNLKSWAGNTVASPNVTGYPLVDLKKVDGTNVAPGTAGVLNVDATRINNIATTSVTAVNSKVGTTSNVLFDGSGNVKSDVEAWLTTTVITPATAGTPDVNVKTVTNNAITAAAIADAAIDQATFAADVPSLAMRTGTAAAGGATTITLDAGASGSNNFYNNTLIYINGGTGIGQSRFITAYVGATKVATVATWVTNPDNTSTFVILPFDAVAGATAPTVAQIATGVWGDTTAGDFTVANSVGKSVMNGVSLGTGLTVNALTTNNDKTGYALTAAYDAAKTAAQAGDAMALTAGERNSTADALLDRSNAVESGITPRGALRLSTAMAAGKTNGMDTAGTAHVRDVADGKNRVTATVDGAGNRTATSIDVT